MAAENYETLVQALYALLNEDFAVPHVAMRLWNTVLTGGPRVAPCPTRPMPSRASSASHIRHAGDLEAHTGSVARRARRRAGASVALIP